MRLTLAVAACLTLGGLAAAGNATAAIRKQTDIPAEGLAPALSALAKDRDFQIVYVTEEIANVRTEGAVGEFTTEEALKKLLIGTGLTYRYLDDKTVTVGSAKMSRERSGSAAKITSSGSPDDANANQEGKKSSSGEFRVAQVDQGKDSGRSSVGEHNSASQEGLQEIIVTAQKKSERLQDVPVPVTVLNTDALAENNLNRLQDYFASVPGLSLTSQGNGMQSLAIRGITTGTGTNPTVGITIDDVPYGSSQSYGGGSLLYPDIDPSDLARIEVLRGPQGTLYGADSIGGLIKYVTLDPSTTEFSGRVQMLGDDVEHGNMGYGLRAAVNIPISDTFAIRASGFTRRDAGYIDNVTTGQTDVNQTDIYGGRVSALWRPSEIVSLKLSAMLQKTYADGSAEINTNSSLEPTLGLFQQTAMPGTGQWNSEAQLYTAKLQAKLAGLDFVSISAFSTNNYSSVIDSSLAYAYFSHNIFQVSGAAAVSSIETQKFTQEFRLSSPGLENLDWMLGAFYTHENSPSPGYASANNATTGAPVGVLVKYDESVELSEYSMFADLTLHFTDRFDLQFGGRESENRQTYNETDTGPIVTTYAPSSPYVQPSERVSGSAFTYLVTPRFKISPDLMLYARAASGYRVGGLNLEAALSQIPPSYSPDKTNSYEIGIKTDWLDHILTVDASLFYIAWKQIQISLINPITLSTYYANGGDAKSEGLEVSLQVRPTPGLIISAEGSWENAELTQNFPVTASAIGSAGDRLPFSSRLAGSLTVDQDIVHSGGVTGYVGGTLSYVGGRQGDYVSSFTPTQPRLQFPGYVAANLHGGARYASWDFSLFFNNVADKRGILGGNPTSSLGSSGYFATIIQPRTVGLSVTRAF
jgi:iron complex outermembrane receptor protein